MNPAIIPLVTKAGSYLLDRFVGSKKAKAATAAGTSAIASTKAFNPGAVIFPHSPEYAAILNGICYLLGTLLVLYREKKKDDKQE